MLNFIQVVPQDLVLCSWTPAGVRGSRHNFLLPASSVSPRARSSSTRQSSASSRARASGDTWTRFCLCLLYIPVAVGVARQSSQSSPLLQLSAALHSADHQYSVLLSCASGLELQNKRNQTYSDGHESVTTSPDQFNLHLLKECESPATFQARVRTKVNQMELRVTTKPHWAVCETDWQPL